jgi:hypothetical protein
MRRQLTRANATRSDGTRARARLAARLLIPVALLAGAAACGSSSNGKTATTNPVTTPTVGTGGSAAGKPCVGLRGALPAPFTSMPITVGPAPTDLIVKDLKVGSGALVPGGATITADYVGVSCSTGTVFDSSTAEGGPQTFPLSEVIPGWTRGIPGMHVGGQRLLGIPAALAYGAGGRPPTIAPDEALWFVVQTNKIG